MLLSKPLMDMVGSNLQNLYLHPIRTKSVTSCILAALANCLSQYIAGAKTINHRRLSAFATFGLLFGGSLPHYLFSFLETFARQGSFCTLFKQLSLERLLYMPVFQFFQLYMVFLLEEGTPQGSLAYSITYVTRVVKANLKWLTLLQFINLKFVPPVWRVLYSNVLAFFWVMYLSSVRRSGDKRGELRRKREEIIRLANEKGEN